MPDAAETVARKIHFMGIGGVGMAGLAVLLRRRGFFVSGCDLRATPRTRWLEAEGIPVAIGHDPAHVAAADEIVVTPAVDPRHPELLAAAGKPVRCRGEVLAGLVNASADSIAVCGSHGKTTTSTWIAKLLLALGERIAWCIGGETGDFPVAGGDGTLVVEADESDGTLALYRAKTLVVNRCDYDHPDHFKTEDDYLSCYETAKRQAGCVIESETLSELNGLALPPGLAPHNRKNARAAAEVALRRGHSLADISRALPAIVAVLPDRRFQKVAEGVYADYAHHPTEIRCAIAMARAAATGRVRVLFQPHRYSRTKTFLKDFADALAAADEVVLCPTYAAFEAPLEGGDIADLYKVCREEGRGKREEAGVRFLLARSCEEAWEHARNRLVPGDVTLLLGAGDIIALVPEVQRTLRPDYVPAVRRIWIGQGTNTWKSDLALNVEYVRTSGPADRLGASLGIPWMAGIPGTVGGWIRMNAGAFGHSVSEVLARVKVDGRWIDAADCGFGYRTSAITGEIQDFELKPLPADAGTAEEYLARRRRFPAGTKGSVFKNPAGDFAGRLLEAAGAKGLRVGGAYVWSEHANVIVSGPDATPSDFLALARLMRNRVFFRTGIKLEYEVKGLT